MNGFVFSLFVALIVSFAVTFVLYRLKITDRDMPGYKQGQLSCAAEPWTWRTDTGDKHGKIIESAELPEKKENVRYLVQFSNDEVDVYHVLADTETGELVYVEPYRGIVNEDYLRKRLKAFAKISGGK